MYQFHTCKFSLWKHRARKCNVLSSEIGSPKPTRGKEMCRNGHWRSGRIRSTSQCVKEIVDFMSEVWATLMWSMVPPTKSIRQAHGIRFEWRLRDVEKFTTLLLLLVFPNDHRNKSMGLGQSLLYHSIWVRVRFNPLPSLLMNSNKSENKLWN